MSETKYLLFKDADGKVISKGSRQNSEDDNSAIGLWLHVPGAASVESVSQETYDSTEIT